MLKKTLLILLIFSLTSCVENWYKPMGWVLFRQMPKGGTPGYELGWIHGCQSGLGTQFGTSIYQSVYRWSRDADIASANPDIEKIRERYKKELKKVNWNDLDEVRRNFSDYNTIFWGAHVFCRHSVVGIAQAAGMAPPNPGAERYDPAAHNLGSVWKLNGRGDTRIGSAGLW